MIGAERHERSEERPNQRNGYRPRSLTTQVSDVDLLIQKLRAGSFLPSILEPRRRVDQALETVIMEAYIGGVSTRKVDALVAALVSQSRISKSQVSRICREIDEQVRRFLSRPLQETTHSYIDLDATYLRGRLGKVLQLCSRAVIIAMGVNADGHRDLLGLMVGDTETEGFWAEFSATLKERGLAGVRLVIKRRPRGTHHGDQQAAAGLHLAAVPGAFGSQPAAAPAQSPPGHGQRCPAQLVRPGERRRDPQPVGRPGLFAG